MTKPVKTKKRQNPTLDEIQMKMAAGVDPPFVQGKVKRVYHIRHIALVEYAPKDTRKLGRPHFRIYGLIPGCKGDLMDTGLECTELQEALVTAIARDNCEDPIVYADAALRVLGLRGGPLPQGT